MHSCLYSYTVIIQIEILLDAYAKVWALIWNGAYNLDKGAQSLVILKGKLKGLVTSSRVIALVHFHCINETVDIR